MTEETPSSGTSPGESEKPPTVNGKPPEGSDSEKPKDGKNDKPDEKSAIERLKEELALIREHLPKAAPTAAPTVDMAASEKFGYFTEQVAYASAKKAATDIVRLITPALKGMNQKPKILLIDHRDSANNDLIYIELLFQFRVFNSSLLAQIDMNKKIIDEIKTLLQPLALPIEAALLSVPYGVSALAEIASYFRTDYKMFGRDFTVSSDSLITSVAGELVKTLTTNSPQIYIYNNYLLDIPTMMTYDYYKKNGKDLNTLSLLESLTLYCSLVNEATVTVSTLKYHIEKNNPVIKDVLSNATQAVNNTEVILRSASEFHKAVSAIESGQTRSKMGNALIRDKIRRLGANKDGITHLLSLTIPSSGGDLILVRKFRNNRNKYLGGLVISFVLATVEGDILVADTVSYYGLMNFDLKNDIPDAFVCQEFKETVPEKKDDQQTPSP